MAKKTTTRHKYDWGEIEDRDQGFSNFMALVDKKAKYVVQIGIIGKDKRARYKNGSKLGNVAAAHEFGVPDKNIPRRSFLYDTAEMLKDKIASNLIKAGQRAIFSMDVDKELDRIGLWFVGKIQQRIADGIMPPNAPSTIKQKGSSKPLIDTGQLRRSITHRLRIHKIRPKKPKSKPEG